MENDLSSRSLPITIVEVSLLLILNILSLTGNTLVFISVYKNTRLRTATNLYIMALAASDLLSAVFVMPFSTGVLITGKWVFGETFCQFNAFFSLFVIYISPVTMSLTALNRYVKMCKSSQQYNRLFSVGKSRALIASVWIFVACYVIIPRLAGLQAYEFVPGYAQCSMVHLSETGKIINYCIVLALFFSVPLMATIISYTKVAKMIQKHNADASSTLERRAGKNTHHTRHEINLGKSLFVVVFAFVTCWIPFWIIVILWRFNLVAGIPRNVLLLCRFLLYFSNATNPFTYAGMNPVFKKEFRQILCSNGKPKLILAVVKARSENLLDRQNSHGTITDLSPITEGSEIYLNGERKMEEHTMDTLAVNNNEESYGALI